jgi:benzoyl-CoA reductase/2-hydroxyglutaryl-CoA dehydratase subunit BcrC/BadD/HgdB
VDNVLSKNEERRHKQRAKAYEKTCEEYHAERVVLQERSDYLDEYGYFLDLLGKPMRPEQIRERTGSPVMGLFCVQAPFELFHALGVHAVKLCSGSHSAQRLSAAYLPVLMCPMLKSLVGSMELGGADSSGYDATIVPTTCDWVVKMPEIARDKIGSFHYLELPHVKENEKGQKRWLEEIYCLKQYLEEKTNSKLNRKTLLDSMQRFMRVWAVFHELTELKRENRISGIWFTAIANTFMWDNLDRWTHNLELAVAKLRMATPQLNTHRVFLAGAPIIFPNLKMLQLLEQAGLSVCADDLCSSERMLPGATVYDDPSERGLLKALAERYHKACVCPTFADNERRINSILRVTETYDIKGVVFHVLKGCHPYDIESLTIEEKLREHGLKYLKIETDYVKEDSQNILTRLEAFKQTL